MSVPATQSDPMADFQAKLQERVRDDIRELLPPDAVAALVQKAVEKEFFSPRIVKEGSGWNSRDIERPSWFTEEVVRVAEPIIREAVGKAIEAHSANVSSAIEKFLDANKLTVATSDRLSQMLTSAVFSLQASLRR